MQLLQASQAEVMRSLQKALDVPSCPFLCAANLKHIDVSIYMYYKLIIGLAPSPVFRQGQCVYPVMACPYCREAVTYLSLTLIIICITPPLVAFPGLVLFQSWF